MANYYSSADLVSDILFRAGEPTDTSSDFNAAALTYLNRAYQIIWMGGGELVPRIQEEWWWLRKSSPGTLTLQPCIDTGAKVSCTKGSATITFSAAPTPEIDKSLASGWFFKVKDEADVYRIASHASGSTSATLDSVYTGATATGKTYIAYKLEYALATDVLRVISPMRVYQEQRVEIQGGDLMGLERDYPLTNIISGVPEYFAHVGEQRVRFSHYGGTASGELIRTDYDYLRRPPDLTNATGSVPMVPQHYRKTLADAALFYLHQDKNDSRTAIVGALASGGIKAMARENRHRLAAFSREHGQVKTRPALLPQHFGPVRTSAGLIIG